MLLIIFIINGENMKKILLILLTAISTSFSGRGLSTVVARNASSSAVKNVAGLRTVTGGGIGRARRQSMYQDWNNYTTAPEEVIVEEFIF